MRKKILVISQYYFPEPFKINEICEKLVEKGNEITVLTGLPNYNLEDIPEKYKQNKNREEVMNGVKIMRVTELPRKKGVINLVLNYISFVIFSCLKIFKLEKDFDLVLVYQLSPVFMGIPGVLYKKLYKKPLFLYCLDLWPESMKIIIKNDKNIISKIVKIVSKSIYKNADKIAVTSKPFINYFKVIHSIEEKIMEYIPQSGDDKYLIENFKTIDNGIIDFVFMGNIGLTQDIECILKAVEIIKNVKGYQIHFVGKGAFLENAKCLVKEKGIDNLVKFHGFYPSEKMKDFYKLADVCILTLKGGTYMSETMPLKLQGYMAAGKPVVGAINGAAYEVIKESKCGLCVEAGDYIGFSELLKKFIENNSEIENMGKNGREFYKNNFTNKKQIEKILNTIDKLI